MRHISKRFGGVVALDDVSFEAEPGEVHALLGENGAGKSTLIKILGGIHRADAGEIEIDGVHHDITQTSIALKSGISVIHQELALVPEMSVAENIFLGEEPTSGPFHAVDNRLMNRRAQKILDDHNMKISATDTVSSLTVAQQQLVEIARSLSKEARIIVMDEPSDTLSSHEVALLFAAVRELKARGVSVIYISHRIDELFEIADRVTVLRDAKYVGTKRLADTSRRELIHMMVGRDMTDLFARPEEAPGETLLEVRNVSLPPRVRESSFTLCRGEILGFFGLVGAGRTELMRAVFGIDKPESGEVYLRGTRLHRRYPGDSVSHKLAMVPEDRKSQGVILIQDVAFNVTLAKLDEIIRGIRVYHKRERSYVGRLIRELGIQTPSADQIVQNLSGGNQQKVALAKWLFTDPDVLILDEPTRGVDVGAKKEIYEIMKRLVSNGISIIMVSSEIPEILNMSTRVVTMYEGEITAVLRGQEITKQNVLHYATTHREAAV
jgi:ribose transport system ATP-binding protein/inositol transport system ATP-binding protein